MIFRDMTADDLHTVRDTYLPDQVPHTGSDSSGEYRFLVLCGPHEMVLQIKDRVGT